MCPSRCVRGTRRPECSGQSWATKKNWQAVKPRNVTQVPIFLLAMVFSYIPALAPALNTSVGCFTVNEIVQWILCTPVQARPVPLVHFASWRPACRLCSSADVCFQARACPPAICPCILSRITSTSA